MPADAERPAIEALPQGLDAPSLRRRAVRVALVFLVIGLVAAFAPGLGEVRERLADADPVWLSVAVVLELLSSLSYVVMFRPIFCRRLSRRSTYELGMSELAVGSLVPASGAAGLAFGAWALRRAGMPADEIARRTVAFFVLKSGANFVAVVVIGLAMWLGAGPENDPLLTLVPAVLAALAIGAVAAVPALAGRRPARPGGHVGRWRHLLSRASDSIVMGIREAGIVVRRGDWRVLGGSLGYWFFDNAMLWACFRAFGLSPPVTVVLMAYLLGQLGGLIPVPGGLGVIDGGLLGALVVYGVPAAASAAAVLAYRVVLFWVPLLLGAPAFVSLRRGLDDPDRPDLSNRRAGAAPAAPA